ncbi:hypothetical protein CN378_06125 [Bacillus sp. AFS015802]|uniref:hypothetical protein n=1 Tax=Bacillus sp. AFS015802 TaxID=2033486 RepID=UPI000BF38277|nr:hypothetical protein [Bacillus sp. AFS015802]PFA68782.1 hypothetical protein CN378_06125 [Bacillus sp. AFS015802]
MKELSTKGKISVLVGFFSIVSAIFYIFFAMDGRSKPTDQDNLFFITVIIIAVVSVIFTVADRAKTRGGEFSWKKFGIILLIVILFGLWRLTV